MPRRPGCPRSGRASSHPTPCTSIQAARKGAAHAERAKEGPWGAACLSWPRCALIVAWPVLHGAGWWRGRVGGSRVMLCGTVAHHDYASGASNVRCHPTLLLHATLLVVR